MIEVGAVPRRLLRTGVTVVRIALNSRPRGLDLAAVTVCDVEVKLRFNVWAASL
jgi:hypothetical protein